jgi:hypothetical protein
MSPRGPETVAWMHATAAALSAAGMDAQVHSTRGVLDITASLSRPGTKPIEVIIDDDGYAEIRYWNNPDATPAQAAAVIAAALAAINAAQPAEPAGATGNCAR